MPRIPGRSGDRRPETAGADLFARLMQVGPPGASVRRPGGDRAGEIRSGCFLSNPRVTPEEMIDTAAARTMDRVKGPHVLVPQDTTTPRDDGDQNSLNPHGMIAVDARSGAVPGPVHAEFLRRTGGGKQDHLGLRAAGRLERISWPGRTDRDPARPVVVQGDASRPEDRTVDMIMRVRNEWDGTAPELRGGGLNAFGCVNFSGPGRTMSRSEMIAGTSRIG